MTWSYSCFHHNHRKQRTNSVSSLSCSTIAAYRPCRAQSQQAADINLPTNRLCFNQTINQFICQVRQNSKYNEQWWQDNKTVKCANSCPRKNTSKIKLMVRNRNKYKHKNLLNKYTNIRQIHLDLKFMLTKDEHWIYACASFSQDIQKPTCPFASYIMQLINWIWNFKLTKLRKA